MQAVILAAGKGTRTYPLTLTLPKPLLPLLDSTILEHNLNQIPEGIKEIILVIGEKGDQIKKRIGQKFRGKKVRYAFQKKALGTGDALLKAKPFLKEKFLVLNGDDLYQKEDLKKCLQFFPSILIKKVQDPEGLGQVITEGKFVKEIVEKPSKIISHFVNTGVYFLPRSIFDFSIKKSQREEYELPDYLSYLIKKEKLYFKEAKNWIRITYPWDLLGANEIFLQKIKRKIEGRVSLRAKIKGKVKIGKGSQILENVVIEGPVFIGKNCKIGPNAYIRKNSVLLDGCHIGASVEIKNSIIFEGTKISHLSYVGDSIIGKRCNLGAGTITANLRFDKDNIKSMVKGKLIDTKRKKFGAILGDEVQTGIGTLIYPGRKIWPQKMILPGEIVKKDFI